MTLARERTFADGTWHLAWHCRNHGLAWDTLALRFANGKVAAADPASGVRVDGAYDPATGQVSLAIEWTNGSVDRWFGVADGEAIWGSFQELARKKGEREICHGPFRMWLEAAPTPRSSAITP